MRFLKNHGSLYFFAGPLFYKCLEVGVQSKQGKGGFDFYVRFRSKGDHAGFTFFIELWGLFFEFNVHDDRHWNYEKDAFFEQGEEQARELGLDE